MKIRNKLAFKITVAIGIVFVLMLISIYRLYSQTVIYEFESFLQVSDEAQLTAKQVSMDPAFKVNLQETMVSALEQGQIHLNQQLQNYPGLEQLLVLVYDAQFNIIATNQLLLKDAKLTFVENQLTITTRGFDEVEFAYGGAQAHPIPGHEVWYYILPYDAPTDLPIDIEAEEQFRIAITQNLMWQIMGFVLLGLILIWWLIRRYTQRLSALSEATLMIQDGTFPPHIEPKGDDELTDLTQHFNDAFVALKKQEELRKNMVSDVAHELRTPLTHLRGTVESILDGLVPGDHKAFENINQQIIYLTRIVQDLQDLTLAQAGELKIYPEPCLLSDEIEDIIQGYQNQYQEHRVHISHSIQSLTTVVTDKTRFKQIMINLIDNAVKHSDETIHIQIQEIRQENKLGIVVQDNGPGIPSQHLKSIFQRKSTIKEQQASGMGLGLSIVRQLVELQGLKIEVRSQPGNTQFVVWF